MFRENTVGKYTIHRLILTLVKRKNGNRKNHYITLNSFYKNKVLMKMKVINSEKSKNDLTAIC